MKDWKLDIKKSAFIKTFDFYEHQGEAKGFFLGSLLNFNSKKYKIDVVSTNEGCLVSFVMRKTMYKKAIDNVICSIDLTYKESTNGKED